MELRDRPTIEAEFRIRYAQLTANQKERLLAIAGDPPRLERVPEALWREFERERQAATLLMLMSVFGQNAVQHGLDERLLRFTAPEFARRTASTAVGSQMASLRSFLTRPPSQAIIPIMSGSGQSPADMAMRRKVLTTILTPAALDSLDGLAPAARRAELNRLAAIHGVDDLLAQRQRADTVAQRIASAFSANVADGFVETQFTAASAGAAEFTARLLGLVDADDVWILHPELSMTGPCEICEPLGGTPRSVWGAQFPNGPPAHARCCCSVRLVRMDDGAIGDS